jgi:hypothetical protein
MQLKVAGWPAGKCLNTLTAGQQKNRMKMLLYNNACEWNKNMLSAKSVRVFLVICLLVIFFTPVNGWSAQSYDANTISMFTMNSATALRRIRNGHFSIMYRGFGSRKAGEIDRDELLGFRFMLDLTHQSRGLRTLIEKNETAGMSPDQAFEKARLEQSKVLQQIFSTLDSTSELYENRRGKSFEAVKAGVPDPETHFLFCSPRIGVARMYGPIVMVIQETRPRGMDLNGIARDARYYSLSRFLKNIGDLDFRMILADYVADRDEYVIPSYIRPMDVSGLIVHSNSPVVIGNRVAIPPPAIRRVYRKHRRKGAMVIDVVDGKDRLIARLTAAPSAADIEAGTPRSPEKLPDYIQKAWDSYVKTLRRKR